MSIKGLFSVAAAAALLTVLSAPPTIAAESAASVTAAAASIAAGPSACAPEAKCCPTHCITYRHALLGRCRAARCSKPLVSTTLCATNPRTCCKVNVPVCLPACCDGCPAVRSRCALLGDGVVTYDWCCGVSVTVRFQRCGSVLVTYHGV